MLDNLPPIFIDGELWYRSSSFPSPLWLLFFLFIHLICLPTFFLMIFRFGRGQYSLAYSLINYSESVSWPFLRYFECFLFLLFVLFSPPVSSFPPFFFLLFSFVVWINLIRRLVAFDVPMQNESFEHRYALLLPALTDYPVHVSTFFIITKKK